MQIIETYVLPPTNHRGARIKGVQIHSYSNVDAVVVTKSLHDPAFFVDEDGNPLRDDQHHARMALLVMEQLNWCGSMIGGHSRRGMVWVFKTTTDIINRDESGRLELDVASKWERTIKDADYRLIK